MVGDPLDVKMFEATGWVLDEPKEKQDKNYVFANVYPPGVSRDSEFQYSSAIIRRFEFSSALQRMSVLCSNQIDDRIRAFVKGSPEMISTLCRPETMP